MAEERVERRLAAILAADVVGYSYLMEQDEAGTLARLKTLRRDVFDPMTKRHSGRIFKITGDGAFVEFKSAVDALNSATDIQKILAARNAELLKDKKIALRIGISLGDVIVEGSDLYGNGVNVASRLEALAAPGGICISGNVHEHVRSESDFAFEDLGLQSVKNISEPVRCFRVTLSADKGLDEETSAAKSAMILRRPAVAVLPFENMSGDTEQEYFADGLTEDIITALSLWRSFPVIARNSAFSYKGQSPDVRKVAAALGARYIVEGSVRRGDDRLRVAVQLIDAESGHHIWAERYDRKIEDIFDVQDEIAARVAAAIEPELSRFEYERTASQQTDSVAAWDLYARGLAHLHARTKGGHLQARELFEGATEIDPTFSRALALVAVTYHRDLYQGSSVPRDQLLTTMTDVCRRAVRAGPRDGTAHHVLGLSYIWHGEYENAYAEGCRSVALNPSEAAGHVVIGMSLDLLGKPEEALDHLETGARLNPSDPRNEIWETILARACFNACRYEDAIRWTTSALQIRDDFDESRLILAASLGHLNRTKEVRSAIQLDRLNPPDYARVQILWSRYKGDKFRRHMEDGLRKAGLLE